MRRTSSFVVVTALLGALAGAARADFVPGRLYVTADAGSCDHGIDPPEQIWEFDPATGKSRLFAQLGKLCGASSGLAFTPDGSGLRLSIWGESAIVEFDGDANMRVVLDADDGIAGPLGSNNLAYDRDGDFYVGNWGSILRFPAGGGSGEVFADFSDGVGTFGPLALTPDGGVYYGHEGFERLMRFTAPHEGGVFDTLPDRSNIASLAVDSQARLFVNARDGIYRYTGADPTTRERITEFTPAFTAGTLAFSADESVLYLVRSDRAFSIDPDSGAIRELGRVTEDGDGWFAGGGLAVYVPEPGTLLLLLTALGASGHARQLGGQS